jgi:hypothetical protein
MFCLLPSSHISLSSRHNQQPLLAAAALNCQIEARKMSIITFKSLLGPLRLSFVLIPNPTQKIIIKQREKQCGEK